MTTRSAFPFARGQRPPVQRAPRSKSQPPPRRGRLNEPPPRPPPISSRLSLDRHNPANPATMRSDRHPHSNRTGASGHFQRTTDGTCQREYLPPRAFGILKEQKDLIERTVSDPNSPEQHLISVMRKLQAGTSSLLLTDDYHDDEGTGEYKADDDDDTQQDGAFVTVAPPATKSLSPKALHIMQQLETSGFEGTPREETYVIHSLIDHLPLSNFMAEAADVDEVLTTRVGRRHYNPDTISPIVCGTPEQLLKSHWDSCASACFESSMDNHVPNSFVALEKKILTADGGCNSDGMAWRRYHIPIDESWIASGNEYGYD